MATLTRIERKNITKVDYSKGKVIQSPEGRGVVIPKATVLYNNIITSAHNINQGKIISTELSTTQVVVAAGTNSMVNVGDFIEINVDMFPKEVKPGKHDKGNDVHIHPPFIKIGESKYLLMTDRHAKFILDK